MEASSVSVLHLHPFPVDRAYFALQAVVTRARTFEINILTAVAEQGIAEIQGIIDLLGEYEATRYERRPADGDMVFQFTIGDQQLRDRVCLGINRVQEIVRDVVCAIVAYFALQGPDPDGQRGQLLEPIVTQNRAIDAVRKHLRWELESAHERPTIEPEERRPTLRVV